MIDPKMVPDEAAKAAWEYFDGYDMKEAIAAALNAWPNAEVVEWHHTDHTLILPLPQKEGDA